MPEARPQTGPWGAARAFVEHAALLEGVIAVAVAGGTYALLGLPPSPPLLVLAFCGTAAVYGLDRAAGFAVEDRYNRPERVSWWRGRRVVVAVFAAVGAAMLPALAPATLAVGGGVALLSAVYVLPVLPGGRRLKAFGPLKPTVIGVGWGVGGVLLPVVEAGAPIGPAVAALVAVRTLIVGANAALTDWPDRAGDARAGMATFAVRWPWHRLRRGALGAAAAAVLIEVSLTALRSPGLVLVDAAGAVVFAAVVGRMNPARRRDARLLDVVVAWPVVTVLAALLGVR